MKPSGSSTSSSLITRRTITHRLSVDESYAPPANKMLAMHTEAVSMGLSSTTRRRPDDVARQLRHQYREKREELRRMLQEATGCIKEKLRIMGVSDDEIERPVVTPGLGTSSISLTGQGKLLQYQDVPSSGYGYMPGLDGDVLDVLLGRGQPPADTPVPAPSLNSVGPSRRRAHLPILYRRVIRPGGNGYAPTASLQLHPPTLFPVMPSMSRVQIR